ncbi:hypothetical protein NGM37_46100, partial [Streptomyces sp. TRM76130]|nr:hypothetical protein [Streptomyces sp. TRM76130]
HVGRDVPVPLARELGRRCALASPAAVDAVAGVADLPLHTPVGIETLLECDRWLRGRTVTGARPYP